MTCYELRLRAACRRWRIAVLAVAIAAGSALAQPASDAEMPAPRPFATRHAYFMPAAFAELPGWADDDLQSAWQAFSQSCRALQGRSAWQQPCARAARLAPTTAALRAFFEREFTLYEIRDSAQSREGVVTGYYEPLLLGSRSRHGAFQHPVYGAPADLLTLDLRRWPQALRGQPTPARIEGRQVLPVTDGGAAPYLIDIAEPRFDERDKRLRLRLEGRRLLPYWTRAEIERGGLAQAPVLAWVDNAAALYSMQVQGSGRIRLADGRTLRLAYAEQNGHPFRPAIVAARDGTRRVRTRGVGDEVASISADADAAALEQALAAGAKPALVPPEAEAAVPGATAALAAASAPVVDAAAAAPAVDAATASTKAADEGRRREVDDAAVERVIELLAGGAGSAAAVTKTSMPTPIATRARIGKASGVTATAAAMPPAAATASGDDGALNRFAAPSAQALAAISADPSYVFFRELPEGRDSREGPIGALGVPLTAGRSVAVDPRTTPLGFPVWLSTSAGGVGVNRLVMAQDTGGAIRGAVRADYFWGFGAEAYARAARMKAIGRMWLLLPNAQRIAARDEAPRLRGAGAAQPAADCVVDDAELCVEDSP